MYTREQGYEARSMAIINVRPNGRHGDLGDTDPSNDHDIGDLSEDLPKMSKSSLRSPNAGPAAGPGIAWSQDSGADRSVAWTHADDTTSKGNTFRPDVPQDDPIPVSVVPIAPPQDNASRGARLDHGGYDLSPRGRRWSRDLELASLPASQESSKVCVRTSLHAANAN